MFYIGNDTETDSTTSEDYSNYTSFNSSDYSSYSVPKEEKIINKCISPEEIINPDEMMKRVTCKEDYLPYLDQKCKDDELVQFQTANLPAACTPSPSKCENIEQVTINMVSNCDYLYATCDTKSLNSINNLIYTFTPKNNKNAKYIVCGNSLGLDLARFEPGIIGNISSPTTVNNYRMD